MTKSKFKVGDRIRLEGIVEQVFPSGEAYVNLIGETGGSTLLLAGELSHAKLVSPRQRESIGTRIASAVRKRGNTWSREKRAQLLKQGMEIINKAKLVRRKRKAKR